MVVTKYAGATHLGDRMGARFVLADIAKLGVVSLVLIIVEIGGALALMIALARAFELGPKLTALLAIGSSVCGVSAIIATQGAIDADEDDSAFAIASILIIGAVSLFAFPLVGRALHMNDRFWSYALGSGSRQGRH